MSKRILVTGFEGFGPYSVNSSWEGVARLSDDRRDFRAERLPVDHRLAEERLRSLLADQSPEVCLLTGLAAGSACRLERLARRPADAAARSGPTARLGAWDWASALDRLSAANCAAAVSTDPGLYVCETTYRAALDWRAERGWPEFVAFLHVPPLSDEWPSERIAKAIDAMLDAVVISS